MIYLLIDSFIYSFTYSFIHIFIYSFIRDLIRAFETGWPRPIGCLELEVIFRKTATKYRALLRKMTYEDKASYASTQPCS